jgi:hypothetical protein
MMTKKASTTIYIGRDSAALAKELSASTGRSLPQLFEEFLRHLQRSLAGLEPIATVISDRGTTTGNKNNEGSSPLPLLPLEFGGINNLYDLDRWINVEKTTRLILVGTTMYGALERHIELLKNFVRSGKTLRVLLQGDLNENAGNPCYTPIKTLTDEVEERRNNSLLLLKQIAEEAPENVLEVRNSGYSLISYSMILIVKDNLGIDIQIQPYHFHSYRNFTTKPARFVLTTQSDSHVYHLLVNHIEELWKNSLLEFRS